MQYNYGFNRRKYERRREIEHALPLAAVFLVMFLITAFTAHYLGEKSREEISRHYEEVEVLSVVVDEKRISHAIRGGEHYYLHGTAEDGHEALYWVGKGVYDATEVGGSFQVYKYNDEYSSTLSGIVSENAGLAYDLFEVAAIWFGGMGFTFLVIGLAQKWKEGRRERQKRRRRRKNRRGPIYKI